MVKGVYSSSQEPYHTAMEHHLQPDTSEHTPPLTPAKWAGTRFTYSRGMQGWVDLGCWLHAEMVYPPADPSKY